MQQPSQQQLDQMQKQNQSINQPVVNSSVLSLNANQIIQKDPTVSYISNTARSLPFQNSSKTQEIEQMLKNFVTLPCAIHKIRNYDHICILEHCNASQTLFCSKCLLEDEKHTLQHKGTLQSIENYLPTKIEALSGAAPRAALNTMKERVEQLQLKLNQKISKISETIERDFQEIQSNVIAFCTEIRKDLLQQVQNFAKTQTQVLTQFLTDITAGQNSLDRESSEILKDFNDILTAENFDYSNQHMINSFIRKIRAKKNNFSVDYYTQKGAEDITEFTFDLDNNEYYKSAITDNIKSTIYQSLQNPYKEKQFLNFQKMPITKTPYAQNEGLLKTIDDKKTVILADSDKASVVQKVIMTCEHKQPINSLAIVDFQTFVTSANDSKVKIWGFTPNFIIHERSCIDLGADLCLCVKYWKEKAMLFLALAHSKNIAQYDISGENIKSPKLVRTFVGHERTVRTIALIPQFEAFISCSYDETIKLWKLGGGGEDQQQQKANSNKDIKQSQSGGEQKPTFSYFINADARVVDANNKNTVCGCTDGTVKVFRNGFYTYLQQKQQFYNQANSESQEQQQQQSQDRQPNDNTSSNNQESLKNQCKNSLDFITSVKVSKDKITCVSLQQINEDILFCGSASGTVSMWNLSVKQDQQQQQNGQQSVVSMLFKLNGWHKERICSINVFERSQIEQKEKQQQSQNVNQGPYIMTIGWDGMTNIIDVDNKKIISNTKFCLQNDDKKHWNNDASKLIFKDEGFFYSLCVGNDDKRVQLYEVKFNNSKL